MTYAFDPELAPLVPLLPAITPQALEMLRASTLSADAGQQYTPPVSVEIGDRTIPGSDGKPDVTVRVYTPSGTTGPLPGVL